MKPTNIFEIKTYATRRPSVLFYSTTFVILVVLTVPLCLGSIARAQESTNDVPSVLRLSLNEALALFLKQNIDLLIAQYGISTAKGQEITARLFPNPVLNVGTMSSFTMGNTLSKSSEIWANVQQLFEVAGKRGYRIESAKYGRESAETAFEDAIRQLSFTVKDSYFHVQAAKRHLDIAQENRDRFTRILDVNSIRFRKGFISGVDLIRIRLQVIDFESTVIQSSQDLEAALNDLRLVLALAPETTLELTTNLDFHRIEPELPGLQRLASNRPDILVKRFTVSQQTAEFKLARALRYPDPSFGPGITIQGPKGPDNQQQYTLGLSMPLPVFNRNQGGVVQAETALRMAEADLRKTMLLAKNDVNVAFKTLAQSRRLVEVYQAGVLDDAKSSFSIIETAYQRGGATILDLLDAARTAAAVQLNYIDALGMYQRNIFQLESAVGQTLAAESH